MFISFCLFVGVKLMIVCYFCWKGNIFVYNCFRLGFLEINVLIVVVNVLLNLGLFVIVEVVVFIDLI